MSIQENEKRVKYNVSNLLFYLWGVPKEKNKTIQITDSSRKMLVVFDDNFVEVYESNEWTYVLEYVFYDKSKEMCKATSWLKANEIYWRLRTDPSYRNNAYRDITCELHYVRWCRITNEESRQPTPYSIKKFEKGWVETRKTS